MTNKYLRTIYGIDKDGKPGSLQVDVYNVLNAYPTKNPALDHLIKKALCPGQRGHKDRLADLDDIIKSAQRAKELVINQLACTTEVTLSTEGPAVSQADPRISSVKDGPASCETRAVGQVKPSAPDDQQQDVRPSSFNGKTLCFYDKKLAAEGLLKTFLVLAQDAGIPTKRVDLAEEVGPNAVLIDGPNPGYQTIRRMAEKGIPIYGVREANVILRGHRANAIDAPEERKTFRGEECLMKDLTAEGYCYSFSDRPESFDNAIIYVVEGVDPAALERLESEAGPCDTVIEYVRSRGDCPKGAIVIYNNRTKIPLDGEYWNYSIDKAVDILVNDQKGKTTNA